MDIKGSCYCGAVKYSTRSHAPYPFMRCYCSFCRKTGGSGGYGINIMAQADSLVIEGEEFLSYHHGMEHDPDTDELVENKNKRFFCTSCGSPLWAADPRWPEWIYPFAGSVDTPLPTPPEIFHIMLDFAPAWVEVPKGDAHKHFRRYPNESIAAWHKRHGVYQP